MNPAAAVPTGAPKTKTERATGRWRTRLANLGKGLARRSCPAVVDVQNGLLSCPMQPTDAEIQRIASALVREFRPEKIVLFGSRGYRTARPDSDVDLLVILRFEGSALKVMSRLLAAAYRAMETPFAIDVHPRVPLVGAAEPDPVMREAIERGRVLYEAAA